MKKEFFAANRNKLFRKIEGDFVLVSFSGLPQRRSADDDYDFSVNRDFYYLTGIQFKDIVYLAVRKEGKFTETVYAPAVDYMTERWRGRMLHPEEIEEISGVGEHKLREEFMADFWKAAGPGDIPVWLDIDPPEPWQAKELPQLFEERIKADCPKLKTENYFPLMQQLRAVKEPEEVENIRKAISLTEKGIRQILKTACPGICEYQLRAEFEKVLADNGCHTPAFATIVGAGKNSLCLHYHEEDSVIKAEDAILLDLGAQFDTHCADISRMLPATGTFTERQRKLTQLACDTIDYVVENAKPGIDLKGLNAMQDEFLFPRLNEMGLACETIEDVPKKYRWHNISHHLGLDTHDSCGRNAPMNVGSVFTLEVGIYVEDWGEGVRVEDDAYMTESGIENLSEQIPRTPDEIEMAMGRRNIIWNMKKFLK